MRRLVVSTYVTLDGVIEDPAWSAPYWSEEAQSFARELLWASDALLMGRRMYEIFAASWPTPEWIKREGDFAVRMNSLPKYVASTSLTEPLEWQASMLLKGNVVEQVTKLKQQAGQGILMYSSVDLMHTLMKANLIDEYRLWLHPLVLGRGKRLFHEGDSTDLTLAEATTLAKGVVVLAYQPAAAPAAG